MSGVLSDFFSHLGWGVGNARRTKLFFSAAPDPTIGIVYITELVMFVHYVNVKVTFCTCHILVSKIQTYNYHMKEYL